MGWPRRLKLRVIFGITVFSVVCHHRVLWFVEIRLRQPSPMGGRAEQIATVRSIGCERESRRPSERRTWSSEDIQGGGCRSVRYGGINRVVAQTTLRVYDVLKTMGMSEPVPLGQAGSSLLWLGALLCISADPCRNGEDQPMPP